MHWTSENDKMDETPDLQGRKATTMRTRDDGDPAQGKAEPALPTKSAQVAVSSLPSGESDPSVMPGSVGAGAVSEEEITDLLYVTVLASLARSEEKGHG